jgi:hypothetical protein
VVDQHDYDSERQDPLRRIYFDQGGNEMTKDEIGDLIGGALFALVAVLAMFI